MKRRRDALLVVGVDPAVRVAAAPAEVDQIVDLLVRRLYRRRPLDEPGKEGLLGLHADVAVPDAVDEKGRALDLELGPQAVAQIQGEALEQRSVAKNAVDLDIVVVVESMRASKEVEFVKKITTQVHQCGT